MTRYDAIKEALENIDERDLLDVWNNYCYANNYTDDLIMEMDSFDDTYRGFSPLQIAEIIEDSEFCARDNYFKPTTFGVESSDDVDDFVNIDDLATYIDNNDDELDNSDIRDAIDEWNEENEEEESEDEE